MNQHGQLPAQTPLWQRILRRYRYRGHLLRPRVPLVFFRFRSFATSHAAPNGRAPHVVQYQLNLNLQLCWPLLPLPETRCQQTPQQSNVIRRYVKSASGPAEYSRNLLTSSVSNIYELVMGQAHRLQAVSRLLTVFRNAGNFPPAFARSADEHRRSLPPETAPVDRDLVGDGQKTQNVSSDENRVNGGQLSTIHGFPARHFATVIQRGNTAASPAASQRAHKNPDSLRPAEPVLRTQFAQPRSTTATYQTVVQSDVLRRSHVNTDTMTTRVPATMKLPPAPGVGPDGNEPGRVITKRSVYAQPAWRNFISNPVDHGEGANAERLQSQGQVTPTAAPVSIPPQPLALDVVQLSEEVYRHIQRKMRIERERRGL